MPGNSCCSESRKLMTERLSRPASISGVSRKSPSSSSERVRMSSAFSMTVLRTATASSLGRAACTLSTGPPVPPAMGCSANSPASASSWKMPMAKASPAASPSSRKIAAAAFAASVALGRSPCIMSVSACTTRAEASAPRSPCWRKTSRASWLEARASSGHWAPAWAWDRVCRARPSGSFAGSCRACWQASRALLRAACCSWASRRQCLSPCSWGSLASRCRSCWSACAQSRSASASPARSPALR
mmetsp:Transcript_50852/g.145319  ORF Transcript_50852/g.145319 Transcript_50852/m.145319 type:complete len:245 (+) Transcript_50852:342-1076(+)